MFVLQRGDSGYTHELRVRKGDEKDGDMKHVLKEILKSPWSECRDEDIVFTPIGGGITNLLFKAEGPEGVTPALVRLYGKNSDVLIDRERDNHLFHELATLGYAPPYLGRFKNGRIEGFLHARPLTPQEMSLREPVNFVALIAVEMARLHLLTVTKAGPSGVAGIWPTMKTWLQLAKELSFEDPAEAKAVEALDLDWVRQEAAWIEQQLGRPQEERDATPTAPLTEEGAGDGPAAGFTNGSSHSTPSKTNGTRRTRDSNGIPGVAVQERAKRYLSEIVLCHNDLLSGNIMHADGWNRVQVIDFEYSGHNPRGFDIANHFCEHAGFDSNFAESYPTKETQTAFLTAYVKAVEAAKEPAVAEVDRGDVSMIHPGGDESVSTPFIDEAFISALAKEVDRWALPSHLWWATWAIVQAFYSSIDFDFIDYARLRLAGYRLHKKAFFGLE